LTRVVDCVAAITCAPNSADEAELKPWLETYAMGELWEKNILGGRPG